ncbi:AAA family ATPase [Sphingomonas sp. Sphisp140]|uniref:AAA family ATPase n=1 Tax=unclassified Sphingomonas TaxID=196159 RepID=UPI0039B02BAC
MLTQINKIKGFGIFDSYSAAADFPAFGRFNVVYGENGSGKTTLSRLLACLQAGTHPDHPALEFSVETQSGQLTHGQKYLRKVRVFNSDYVDANIGRFDGPLRHILILGEENKAIAEELKNEILSRDGREATIQTQTAAATKLEGDKGKVFSKIAQTIGEATSGSMLRTYRKPDAESAFAKLTNETKSLSDNELEIHRATVRQEEMPALGSLNQPTVQQAGRTSPIGVIDAASGAAERAKILTSKTAQSAVIERLARKPSVATWVEDGIKLHKEHASASCEFCDQPLSSARLQALADHFSVEDQKLKEEIEAERASLAEIIEALGRVELPDRLALYSELRADYDTAIGEVRKQTVCLAEKLEEIDGALGVKLTQRTTPYEPTLESSTEPLSAGLQRVADIMKRHDEKSKAFDAEKAAARDAVEAHYLLTIKDQVDELSDSIVALKAEIQLLANGGETLTDKRSLAELSQSIIDKQAKVSNEHAGGADLTDHLTQFLGRTDLRFESSADGYRVLRRGKPAKRLSEGEKTAIAFLYFLVQLKDQDFDLAEGVVVIDDPISSLDASAIYQAFSFLKNSVQGAKQVFILTHNFEFLRLLINWVRNVPGPKADKTFSMVLCTETENGQSARLAPLDRLLIEHATEYHYLFKVLYTFKSDGTILGCYHVPNIARKVLETFLDFHVPSSKSLYMKLEETGFDPHKKTAIYKFANDLSHHTGKSFDPALVAEAQKNTTYLLEMIEAVAPLHYAGLKMLSEA